MGAVIAVMIAFVLLLWLAIVVRRRALRTLLLTTGVEVPGTTSLAWPRGRRTPHIAVTYTDTAGVTRTAIKVVVSAGDSQLLSQPARVVFDPRRASRDDYVLVGFGNHPSTWYRVNFARAAG